MKNPFVLINNVKKRLSELKKQANETVDRNVNFLEPGIIKCNKTLTVFYNNGHKKEGKAEEKRVTGAMANWGNVDLSTKIARRIFSRFYKRKIVDCGTYFKGQVAIASTAGRTERFINFDEGKLLTKYNRLDVMQKEIENRNAYGQNFNTVPIYESDFEKLFNIEKYVKSKDCDYSFKFEMILKDYVKYSKNCKYKKIKVALSVEQRKNILSVCQKTGLLEDGKKVIDIVMGDGYAKCLCHGDMSYFNVLFDGQTSYYIDMENLYEGFVLHDLFQYLIWCVFYKNEWLIKDYFNGKYDREFSEIFSNVGMKFDKDNKKAYLILSLLENISFNCKNGFGIFTPILKA